MRAVLVVVLLALPTAAAADNEHTVYVEAFGRGGLGGVGYDYQLSERWSIGATLSGYQIYGQKVLSAAPYLGFYVLHGEHHSWFTQLGPQLSRVSAKSPTPSWDGVSRTGLGAQLSTGWEYRNRLVIRTFATLTVGKGGLAPWAGTSIGVEF